MRMINMSTKKIKDTKYTSFEDYKSAMKAQQEPKKRNKHYPLGLKSAQAGIEKHRGSQC